MDQWHKDRFDELHRAGYLKQYSNMAMNMCAAFWWSVGPAGSAEVKANGTICYVNTGTRHIGITADHVYAGYLEDREAYGPDNIECQFGGTTVYPEQRLIGRSPEAEWDLATFDVPEVLVNGSVRSYHHNALRWPPLPLEAKEAALHGGYPQVLRNPLTNSVEFPFQWFVTRAKDVTVDKIGLDPEVPNMHWPGHEGQRINTQFHGQSGGPVYRVIDQNLDRGEIVDRLELVGIIYNRVFDIVLARPAGLVDANGIIAPFVR